MVNIIDEMPKRPKFMDMLLGGVQQAGQKLPGLLGNMAEDQALQRLTGQNFSGLSPEIKQTYLSKLMGQKENKQQNLQAVTDTLDRMESLVSQSGIGMLGAINPSNKASFNRGEFNSLQASLIPLFKQMFPRMTNYDLQIIQDNYIPNPSDREETIKGKINGLRQLIQQQGSDVAQSLPTGEKKERPPLYSFNR
jgi:hypothetical protein